LHNGLTKARPQRKQHPANSGSASSPHPHHLASGAVTPAAPTTTR
jgi:hypothetical protein